MSGRVTGMMLCAFTVLFVLVAGVAMAQLPEYPASAFAPSSSCGCHAGLVSDWSRSMHAQALTDPLYLYKLDKAREEAGDEVAAFCDTCHGAIAMMAGEFDDRDFSEVGGEGVTCDLCHQVTGRTDPIGNISIVVQPDGTRRAQFDDAVSPWHETAYSAFHETAEFCGMCHNVDHPFNGLPLEATYTEWAEGPYAAEGTKCQDCHMTPGAGVTKPTPGKAAAGGPERPHIYQMTFAGGNVVLGDADLAEERLKGAATLDVKTSEVVPSGEPVSTTVTITNSGAGHYLPTGLTDVRRVWVELVATDEGGNETLLGKREFHTVFKDAEGNYPAEIWDAVAVESDDRIPPRGSVSDTWDTVMPADGPLTLVATLYYRSCTEEFAEAAGVEVPTTTMASVTSVVYGSQEQARAAARLESGGPEESNPATPWILVGSAVVLAGAVAALVLRSRRTAGR